MTKEEKEAEVMSLMEALVIAKDKHIGEIMAARGHWTAGQSARVNAAKVLKKLSELGRIQRCDGFWRTNECRGEFKKHGELLTQALVELFVWEASNGN
jgi:hypothetical protein